MCMVLMHWFEPRPERARGVEFCHRSLRWFKHIEPHRTSSKSMLLERARCVEFCHISSGWVATNTKASPPMFLKPSPSHPPCLIQDPGLHRRGGVFSPLRQPLPAQPVAKASPLKPSPSTETSGGVGSRRRAKRDKLQTGQGISTKSTVSIIPYRERKKKTSPDVYAIQNLELEFAFQQEPTVAHVAELAAKLRVSNRFVHQWFYKRQQRQKAAPPEICCEIIPSGMYDVTVEIPTD